MTNEEAQNIYNFIGKDISETIASFHVKKTRAGSQIMIQGDSTNLMALLGYVEELVKLKIEEERKKSSFNVTTYV